MELCGIASLMLPVLRGRLEQELVEQALMLWIHVLNQHKRHPCIRWQRFQQKCECFQTSSRSSDSDHRKDRGLGAFSR